MNKVTISSIKKACYPEDRKKFDLTVSLWVYFVTRPISFYITKYFLWLNFSSNTVTIISLISGLLACISLSFGNLNEIIIGALFYNLFLILDSVDGNIARFKKESSKKGELLDAVVGDIINFLVLPCILIGILNNDNQIFLLEQYNINQELLINLTLVSLSCNLFTFLFFQRKKNILNSDSKYANMLFNERTIFFSFVIFFLRNMIGFAFLAPTIILFSILNILLIPLLYLITINILIFSIALFYSFYVVFYEN